VADVIRVRNGEARRYSARQVASWASSVGARPVAGPEDMAVLIKALLTGLAMQRLLEPETVSDDVALRGLSALLGLTDPSVAAGSPGSSRPTADQIRADQPSLSPNNHRKTKEPRHEH
jgi:hypothetical protein